MSIPGVLLRPLEAVLNRSIAASTPASKLCRELDGRGLALAFRGTNLAVYLVAREERLAVSGDYASDPDAVLTGTPLALAALARPDGTEILRGGRVTIAGDSEVARSFQALLEAARPDWEEELSRLVGDVAAHQIGNALRGALTWGRAAAGSVRRDVSEFLQEESRDVPSRAEVEIFGEDLESLVTGLDRAEARLAKLEANT